MDMNTEPQKQTPAEIESRRILDRVAREAEAGGAPHNAGDQPDWIDLWGTRIGRVLGPAIMIALVAWLVVYLLRG